MVGWLNREESSIVNNGWYTYSSVYPSKIDEIMSKYKPIAPKPPLLSANLCGSNFPSNSDSVMDSLSRLNTPKGNNSTRRGRFGSRCRRKPVHSYNSPSTKGQKRARPLNNPIEVMSEKNHIVQSVTESRVRFDGHKIVYPFNESFSLEKAAVEKHPVVLEIATATGLTKESLVHENSAVFARLRRKGRMNSIGQDGIYDPVEAMEIVSLQSIPRDFQCECGSAKYFFAPIFGDVDEQQQKQVQKEEKTLVTLPLLPETPSFNDSDLGSRASSSTCNVDDDDGKRNKSSASCGTEKSQLRLFGIDCF